VKEINSSIQRRYRYTKIILQLLGVTGGLYGLFLVGLVVLYVKDLFSGETRSFTDHFAFALCFSISGIYLILVAYFTLMRFSKASIKHLCFILAFIIAVSLFRLIGLMQRNQYTRETEVVFGGMAIIIAILFYILTSKMFIKWCSMK
jgi:hypothetical protein